MKSEGWLETTEENLKASKNLYEGKSYQQSVFDLQQSLEKSYI